MTLLYSVAGLVGREAAGLGDDWIYRISFLGSDERILPDRHTSEREAEDAYRNRVNRLRGR